MSDARGFEFRSTSRRARRVGRAALVGGALLVATGVALAATVDVTPASGPSLVARLKTGVDWTAFGRAGESGGNDRATSPAGAGEWLENGFTLTGADLYRLNCRSCHGPKAHGARSGIPPLVGALAAPGEPVAADERGSEIRVRHRLVDGGRVMPPFSHLAPEEVDLLLHHLRALAGQLPASDRTVAEPAMRVGEHVVKATCQVCHDAARGPERQPADDQVITLAEMTQKFAVGEFVTKVHTGSAAGPDGRPARMPHFDYLSTHELEAAYVYLTAYPPVPKER